MLDNALPPLVAVPDTIITFVMTFVKHILRHMFGNIFVGGERRLCHLVIPSWGCPKMYWNACNGASGKPQSKIKKKTMRVAVRRIGIPPPHGTKKTPAEQGFFVH